VIVGSLSTVRLCGGRLSYHDLDGLAEQVRRGRSPRTLVVELAETEQTTTAALARLVVLRGQLRRNGGELRLAHLHGQPRRIYEVNRLTDALLPCDSERRPRSERRFCAERRPSRAGSPAGSPADRAPRPVHGRSDRPAAWSNS